MLSNGSHKESYFIGEHLVFWITSFNSELRDSILFALVRASFETMPVGRIQDCSVGSLNLGFYLVLLCVILKVRLVYMIV